MTDEFMAVAAHELRSPVATLFLALQSLCRRIRGANPVAPDELERRLDSALRQTRRLNNLVQNLLDVTLLRTSRIVVAAEPTSLSEIVRDVVSDCRPLAEAAGCALRLEAPKNVIGSCDPGRLEQIVVNLVGNACKYAAGSTIRVLVRDAGSRAQLVVEDDGPGIRHDDLDRIFNPFVRGRAANDPQSLGLGLYIVRGIASAHGGSVHVDSTPGKGARFTVSFPKKQGGGGVGES